MNKAQKAELMKSLTSLYIELKLYFVRGGHEDDWLPEAIQRAKWAAEKIIKGRKP